MVNVYKREIEDGLSDFIENESRISYASSIYELADAPVLPNQLLEKAIATNLGQPDLFYLKSILVSSGLNRNDDFFDPIEMWNARNSVEDKPFNLEHEQNKIIGHITSSSVVDTEGKIITEEKDLPEKFHIYSTAVMYTKYNDKEYEKNIQKLIQEILDGEWFVSMEALFPNFDYLLFNEKESKIVKRNEETAFLTKYLRAAGGKGKYKDYKIGRVLRDIIFHGKGLVKKPGNPDSIIFTINDEPLTTSTAKMVYTFSEEINMTEQELAELNMKLTNAENKVNELTAQVNELTTAKTSAANLAEQLTKEKEELNAQLNSVKAELQKINDDKKKADRISSIEKILEVETSVANEIFELLSDLSDEKFEKAVSKQKAIIDSKKQVVENKATASEVLDKVENQVEPPLTVTASSTTDHKIKDLQFQVANFLKGDS